MSTGYVILKFENEYLQQHADDFNTTAALYELYKYIQQYYEDVSTKIWHPLVRDLSLMHG